MQHSGTHAFGDTAHLIDHHEMMRILGRVPPVEPRGRHEKATMGRAAYKGADPVRTARRTADAPRQARRAAWALVPNARLVAKALKEGRGRALVAQWDDLARTDPWSGLAAAFGAAQAARPNGALAEKHRGRAASGGFDIVTVEQSRSLRARLLGREMAEAVDLDL